MALKTTRGVVIAEKSLNDSDKILTIFSENGKFKAIAHGIKNPKSSLAAGCRLFAWTEFQYYPGKNFARISQANLIDPFYSLSTDLTVVTYSSYIAELINQFFDDFQVDKIVLKQLVFCFFYISRNLAKVYLFTLSFQLKLLKAMGINPDLKGLKYLNLEEPVYFNINNSDFSNTKVINKLNYRLNKDEINILLTLYQLPVNKINQLELSDFNEKDLKHLIEVFNVYIETQLNKEIKSFKVLKELDSPLERI